MNIPLLTSGGTLIITVHGEKAVYLPGERISGTVELRQGGTIHARSLSIALRCHEFVSVSCGSGKHRRSKEEWVPISSREFQLGGEGDYSDCRRDFELEVPADAPPTIKRRPEDSQEAGAGIKWELHARLDVPWGVDANARKTIFVR